MQIVTCHEIKVGFIIRYNLMDDSITLRQGLEEFHKEYKNHLSHNKEGISADAVAFFKSHDIAHVLFGCDISLYGEGAVKIWTIFGTTLSFWKHITGYQDANAFELAKNFTFVHIIRNIFKFLFAIPSIIIRANQMYKRWDWEGFESYLDTPISEIRKEFNIKILEQNTNIQKD